MTNHNRQTSALRSQLDSRLYVWRLIIALSLLILAAALAFYQVLDGDRYVKLAQSNRLRLIRTPPIRGRIYDRNGLPLALNVMTFDIMGYPLDLANSQLKEQFLRVLDRHGIPLKQSQLEERISKRFWTPFRAIALISNLPMAQMTAIVGDDEFPRELFPMPVWHRSYPAGPLTAHVVGYVGEIAESELDALDREERRRYIQGDGIGKSGVERVYEALLRGESGETALEVDSRGRPRGRINEKTPEVGQDLYLTLDLGAQRLAANLLGDYRGAVVALDVRNGEVLVLYSNPAYDPNPLAWGVSPAEWSTLQSDPSTPMLNRAISGRYSPGSIFKVISGYAALEKGAADSKTRIFCSGKYQLGTQTYRCWRRWGHGRCDIVTALRDSCDVYFYELSQIVGIDGYLQLEHRLGLGQPTGIDLPNEARGNLAGPQWTRSTNRGPWRRGDTVNYSIGQGYLLLTPLQMASIYSTYANGGRVWRPHLKMGTEPVGHDAHLSPTHLALIHQGLEAVTTSRGTGQSAGTFGIAVAGKSGTVQNPHGPDHAVFAAFAPAKDPRYAVVFFVEAGESGGSVAAPMAGELLSYLVNQERKAGSS